MRKERRKSYFINNKFQLLFVRFLLVQAIVPILILGISLYIINQRYLLKIQSIVGNSLISDAGVRSILDFSIFSMLALVSITAILLIILGVRFSHRVAGPLAKLQDSMAKLSNGERVEPIKFRKTDIMGEIAGKYNLVLKHFNREK